MSNPNAFAAALTGFFVGAISSLSSHFHLVEITPDRILAAASAATFVVLWIGHEGLRGAARRVWNGAKSVYTGSSKTTSKQPAKG